MAKKFSALLIKPQDRTEAKFLMVLFARLGIKSHVLVGNTALDRGLGIMMSRTDRSKKGTRKRGDEAVA